jgi:hypothetical protein
VIAEHDDALADAAAQGIREQTTDSTRSISPGCCIGKPDDHAQTRAGIDQSDRRLFKIREELARHGFVLHLIDPGTGCARYVVVKWGRARELRDVAEVEAFLDRVGGAP